jgi:hypothetical protein
MQISEHLFPHLIAEHDARIERELEQRRVVLERLAEEQQGDASPTRARRHSGRWSRSLPRPA